MFTAKSTKIFRSTTIVIIFAFCLSLTIGCAVNKLSDQDRKWLTNENEMGALESKNTQLTDENTELKKNKDLEDRVGQFEKENTELKKKMKVAVGPQEDEAELTEAEKVKRWLKKNEYTVTQISISKNNGGSAIAVGLLSSANLGKVTLTNLGNNKVLLDVENVGTAKFTIVKGELQPAK